MYKVHIPSTTLYVTPEQLPRMLANLAETRFVADSGEFLQVLPYAEPSVGETTATLLVTSPVKTLQEENNQYKKLWEQARGRAEKAEAKLAKSGKKARGK
jgi:hypothetical protein